MGSGPLFSYTWDGVRSVSALRALKGVTHEDVRVSRGYLATHLGATLGGSAPWLEEGYQRQIVAGGTYNRVSDHLPSSG